MHWLYLGIAAVFEIAFALGTHATKGFARPWPSVFTLAMLAGGIFFLSLALRTLDVSVGYSVWTGIGSVGTVVFGALIFHESITWLKAGCFVALINGVIGLRLTTRSAHQS